jgi:Transposase C of IS166 homeodomain
VRPLLSANRCTVCRVTSVDAVLPDLNALDFDALKALVIATHTELISHKNEIESLKLLILKLKRMQFGPSSERLGQQIDQLELRLEDRKRPAEAALF